MEPAPAPAKAPAAEAGKEPVPAGKKDEAPKPATMSRDDFKAKVLGKTQDEVLKAVGKPDRTTEGVGEIAWVYYGRTTDPVAGQTDRSAVVTFARGSVSRISFF